MVSQNLLVGGLAVPAYYGQAGFWLAGNEGMERNMESVMMGHIGFRRKGKENGNLMGVISGLL